MLIIWNNIFEGISLSFLFGKETMNKADETPIGNVGRRIWSLIKEYGLVFLAGAASGVGVTLAVQHFDQQSEQVVQEGDELPL